MADASVGCAVTAEIPSCSCSQVERIRRCGLRDDDARPLGDEAERLHHVEPGAKRADVAEIAARDDDDVGHRPVELLHDLDADGLLSLEAQAVHRVREVDALFAGSRCTIAMQPSKSVSSESTSAPFASGCTSWAVETLPRGRMTIDGISAAAA